MFVNSIFYMENTVVKSPLRPYWTINHTDISITNVLIHLVSIDRNITFSYSTVEFQKKQFVCPFRITATELLSLNNNNPHVYECEASCTPGMTKPQYGLHATILRTDKENPLAIFTNIICEQCPLGAKCEGGGHIKSLPNYWGYRDKKRGCHGKVST